MSLLNQRKKELAVLQAIGASPTINSAPSAVRDIIDNCGFDVTGLILGIGLAFSFNGFFDVFGFIFQLFGGASTNISRELGISLVRTNVGICISLHCSGYCVAVDDSKSAELRPSYGAKGGIKMSDIFLKASSLYHVYESKAEDGNVVALRGIHIDINKSRRLQLLVLSSGKSTLMKCLGGLMKPSSGSVMLAGKNMTRLSGKELVHLRQKTVSFIFQEGNLLPDMNARDNVAQPLRHQGCPRAKP